MVKGKFGKTSNKISKYYENGCSHLYIDNTNIPQKSETKTGAQISIKAWFPQRR